MVGTNFTMGRQQIFVSRLAYRTDTLGDELFNNETCLAKVYKEKCMNILFRPSE